MTTAVCKCCERDLPNETKFCPYCREQVTEDTKSKNETSASADQKGRSASIKKSGKGKTSNSKNIFVMLWSGLVWFYRFLWKHFWVWLLLLVLLCSYTKNNRYHSNYSTPTSTTSSYNPSPNYSTESNGVVTDGSYSCSQYYHNQAALLNPPDSEKESIESTQADLKVRKEELDNLMTDMNNMGITSDSPQYEIDSYNQKVDEYNSKKSSYNNDWDALQKRIDDYNASINAYNDYLAAHCSK